MDIIGFLKSVVSEDQAQVLIYLVLANLILGTVAAMMAKKFELVKLRDFAKRTIEVFGTYLGVSIASMAIGDYSVLRAVCWAALVAFMAAQILANLKDLGISPIPASLGQYVEGNPKPAAIPTAADTASFPDKLEPK